VVSSHLFDRRRAERFAQLLDEANGRRRTHRRWRIDDDLSGLVTLAARTRDLPTAPKPDPEFRTGLRAMLMAKIERDGIGTQAAERAVHAANRAALAGKTQPIRQVPTGAGRTRAAVLIGVTAGALALSGVSAASTKALPGDPLYPVKLSSERAQLALAGSDVSRGKLRLEFARVRLSEARQVPTDVLPQVLADMARETEEGVLLLTTTAVAHSDPVVLNLILDFIKHQRATLNDLRAALGRAGDAATESARRQLNVVEARAKQLRDALRSGCDVGPRADNLGPRPSTC
jgi:hypothetical protein